MTSIIDLPSEVLSHIFSYLPYNIKVVRLVCSQWNESCNIGKVSGREKVFVDGSPDAFFRKVRFLRNIYNIELIGTVFETDHVSIFKKFGDQLRSLKLHHCSVGRARHVNFLQYCENLNTLILSRCCPAIVRSFRNSDGSFIQTKIVSLTIETYRQWSDDTMDSCFRICPHLTSLTLIGIPLAKALAIVGIELYSFEDGEERVFNRSDVLSFSCIYHALSTRATNIVELNLEQSNAMLPVQIEQIASLHGLRLRKLLISFHDSLTQGNICNIVNLQPDLRDITIRFCLRIKLNESADWIERCSRLTHLEIKTIGQKEFVLDRKLLDALASRLHLRVLNLMGGEITHIDSNFENSPETFDHLSSLKLGLLSFDYICFLKKVSVNLQHLTMREIGISSRTLELVSNRFVNFESLEFTICDQALAELCKELSLGQTSFWSFGKLKTLKIEKHAKLKCPISLLTRFKAPNLQYLKLHGFGKISASSFSDLVENFPLLECFEQWFGDLAMDPSYLPIIKGWKRLNAFYLEGIEMLRLHREN